MKITNISLNRPEYYKNYYQKNKEYLRHRQRLRYYRNTPRFYELLKQYNKILLEKQKADKCIHIVKNNKFNKSDTNKNFIIDFN